MIKCKYCKVDQPDTSFDICKKVGDKIYRRLKCTKCKRKDKNIRRQHIRIWLEDYKKSLSCVRCGFSDFRALVFHHATDDKKDFNVADMVGSGSSIEKILQEIGKCETLCSNCHQIEHYPT